jgi:hypothetical protein
MEGRDRVDGAGAQCIIAIHDDLIGRSAGGVELTLVV